MKLKCLKPRLSLDPVRGWQPDSIRGTRQERGYGAEWEKLRIRILERDMGLCVPCANRGYTTLATQVDHIKPKAQGGTDEESNLQAICDPCHRHKTSRESRQ